VSLFGRLFSIDALMINKPSPEGSRDLSFKRLLSTFASEVVKEKNQLLSNGF